VADVAHNFGSDLSVGPTGDLAVVTGTAEGQQRVLRRLLTNPGVYIWHLPYGAGLARFIGQPTSEASIAATARGQMFKEKAVTRDPAPTIEVQTQTNGLVTLSIQYIDADTSDPVPLTVPISG
jgi:hypothetical protein